MENLYSGFSNYEEENLDRRRKSADEEPAFWGGRKDEFIQYRKEWNQAAKDPLYVPKRPLCVTVDASSLCNLRCLGCGQSAENNVAMKNLGKLELAKAINILDQCVKYKIPSVSFSHRGEPTLNKDLPKMIAYAKTSGILETRMVTNAFSPHKNILIECAEAGLNYMIISVDGHSSDTFEKYRRGSNYIKVLGNVFSVLGWKKENKSNFPIIRIQCVRTKFNNFEIETFLKYWNSIEGVNDVRISDVMDRSGKGNEYSASNQRIIGRTPCPQIRQRLVFTNKAETAYACCHDWTESYPLGSLDTQNMDIMDIWTSSQSRTLRALHSNGKYEAIPMCKTGICAAKETYVFERNK